MPAGPAHASWLADLAERPAPSAVLLLGVARRLADALGAPLAPGRRSRLAVRAALDGAGSDDDVEALVPPLPAGAEPALLGQAHEALLGRNRRRSRGVFYTPADVAASLTRFAGEHVVLPVDGSPTVCDPACGGGAFLLAAADWLVARGVDPATVVDRCLWGLDVDELAVAVTETALDLWAGAHGVVRDGNRTDGNRSGGGAGSACLAVGDALSEGVRARLPGAPGGFDLVVGNPPFLNQLGRGTAYDADTRARLRERFGDAAFRYTDAAALFLLEAVGLVRPGGVVSLVLPDSVLVAADTRHARAVVLDATDPVGLWWAGEPVFAAGVRVWAPVLRRRSDRALRSPVAPAASPTPDTSDTPVGGEDAPIERRRGRAFVPAGSAPVTAAGLVDAPTWSRLVADLDGVPVVDLGGPGARIGDSCTATAGFRDQFYGLAGFVHEAADPHGIPAGGIDGGAPDPSSAVARLVTSGLVDPARCWWGVRPTRFAGRTWQAPVVDLVALRAADPALADWTAARLVPKVLVATQTRVVEAAVDEHGCWFPSVPTIALTPPVEDLFRVGAAVLAPPVSAWALARHLGAALSADAIKLSARQVLEVPLPTDAGAWDEGAALLAALTRDPMPAPGTDPDGPDDDGPDPRLVALGRVMTAAYGADEEVFGWWLARLAPRRPGARRRRRA